MRGAAVVGLPPADAPDDEINAEDDDALVITRKLLARTLRVAREAEAGGNYTAAQRANRDCSGILVTIRQLEENRKDTADVLRVPLAKIDEAMAAVQARVAAICDRPLLCAHCSRALSVSLGTGEETPAPAA